MDLNDFGNSKYLAGADVGERGILVTIKAVAKQRVGQGASAKDACIIYFHETMTPDHKPIKPMVCNKTNASRIAQMTGHTQNVDRNWVGAKIVVYFDPNVEFGGKLVGGLRVRAPRNQAQAPIQQPRPVSPMQRTPSDVPFPAVARQQYEDGRFVPPDQGAPLGPPPGYGDPEQGGALDGQEYSDSQPAGDF